MYEQYFTDWLNLSSHIWKDKAPKDASKLGAKQFVWYERPFNKPITTHEDLVKEWSSVLNQKDINLDIVNYGTIENVGYAKWSASFTLISTGKRLQYEGIYKVTLDEKGQCTEFHQWFNFQEI